MSEIVSYIDRNKKNLYFVIAVYISIFFNSIVLFQQPFEFYIGYIVFVFLLPLFFVKHGMNRNLFFIFLILFLVGIYNVFAGNNTSFLFLKVYVGLFMSYFFYDYVILELDFDIEQLFKWYLKAGFIASVIGAIQFVSYQIKFTPGYDYSWLLNKWSVGVGGNFGIRVNSIFAEPSYYATVLSASFFVGLYNVFSKTPYYFTKLQSIIVVAMYLLSFSGLGQVGVFLTLFFIAVNFGLLRYILIMIPIFALVFYLLYNNVREFRGRYDSTVGLFKGEKFELGKTHGSSFILYNNFIVATTNFKTNYLFGTGIGSHPVAFEKYSVGKDIKVRGFNLNSADANSMLLRLISETGLFGVGIFLFIIFKYYVRRQETVIGYHWLISNAILIMILLNLFRQGHYFLNGFPFFVLLYIYNSFAYDKHIAGQQLITDVSKA